MGRLITEEAVYEYLSSKFDEFNISIFGNEFAGKILDGLSDIPTAYDVKNVEAELDKAESVKTFGSLNSGNRLIPVKDAINIVKKGGIPAAEQEEGAV